MATQRIRHVRSQREAEQLRDEYITLGYKITSEGEATTVVKKETWGTMAMHIVVAIVTLWWTLGIGNLLYALVAHKNDEVLIRLSTEGVAGTNA